MLSVKTFYKSTTLKQHCQQVNNIETTLSTSQQHWNNIVNKSATLKLAEFSIPYCSVPNLKLFFCLCIWECPKWNCWAQTQSELLLSWGTFYLQVIDSWKWRKQFLSICFGITCTGVICVLEENSAILLCIKIGQPYTTVTVTNLRILEGFIFFVSIWFPSFPYINAGTSLQNKSVLS